MNKTPDWIKRGYKTFREWLDTEFLPDGGFITDFKKHAMQTAFRAGIQEGAKMSKGAVKSNNDEVAMSNRNPNIWLK